MPSSFFYEESLTQAAIQHQTYIFIAPRNRDIPIIPLSSHHRLNTIRNQIPRLQTITHSPRPHRDRITNPNRIKPKPNHPSLLHPLLHRLSQTHQVHITSISFIPHRRDPDLGFLEVVVIEADAVEDGLSSALGFGLGDAGAVAVELRG